MRAPRQCQSRAFSLRLHPLTQGSTRSITHRILRRSSKDGSSRPRRSHCISSHRSLISNSGIRLQVQVTSQCQQFIRVRHRPRPAGEVRRVSMGGTDSRGTRGTSHPSPSRPRARTLKALHTPRPLRRRLGGAWRPRAVPRVPSGRPSRARHKSSPRRHKSPSSR